MPSAHETGTYSTLRNLRIVHISTTEDFQVVKKATRSDGLNFYLLLIITVAVSGVSSLLLNEVRTPSPE